MIGTFPEAPMSLTRVLLSTLTLSAALPLAAQDAAPPPPPKPSWEGEAGLSYVKNSGNSDSSSLGATLKLFHDEGAWRIGVGGTYLRSEDTDVTTAERIDALLRGERALGERFSIYSQFSYLRNQFAGIDGSESLEAGGLYKLAAGPKHFLALTGALGYNWEQRIPPDVDHDFFGGRAGLAYKWQISPTADFTEDLDYLQSFKDSVDGRFTSKTALTASINKVFAIKLSNLLTYYHDPVPGKKKTDNTIFASIVAKWPAPAPPPPPCPPPPPPPAS
jgi:putative salt-induced outer membrane protein